MTIDYYSYRIFKKCEIAWSSYNENNYILYDPY